MHANLNLLVLFLLFDNAKCANVAALERIMHVFKKRKVNVTRGLFKEVVSFDSSHQAQE